ncbi:helix-turn-helix transcriptional regulator [Saccharopolyspora dendranthemae]|uniref:Transcriptional regulator n=1 Tax=Saccharopolyspora dendranthemae TaxID=1181886 RepID=A0A561V785_9PSEU|nr:helix-turn-helix domain-containing protein [Saccharopolyspora dendranthemae]TWG07487.1 transcriptional regulator [Saccharopolyspora dendranthemae]
MPSRNTRPQDGTGRRGDIVRALRTAARPLPIAEIADQLQVHPNTVRFHMDALVANGQVEPVSPEHRTPGRPPRLFQAVAGMNPTGPRHYRLLAEVLVDAIAAEPDRADRAVEAGSAWGRKHGTATGAHDSGQAVDDLVALLDDIGFAPERETDRESGGAPQISLRNCPFLEFAATEPQITCAIHLGLMRGAVGAEESPITVERLEPFAAPDRCVVHLATAERD